MSNQQNMGFNFSDAFDGSALKVRLETESLTTKVELFLRGQKEVIAYDEENKTYVTKVVQFGEPLANEIGIQSIVSLLQLIVSTQGVQGNLTNDEINQIVFDVKLDLAFALSKHSHTWGIKKQNREHINRSIEKISKIFLSRTKDNKERESYIPMIKHIESSTINNRDQIGQKSGFFNFFGGKKGDA